MASKPDNISADMATPLKGETRKFRYSTASAPAASVGPTTAIAAAAPSSLPLNWQQITIALLAVLAAIIALYPADLQNLAVRWYSDSGWSHGFVVPLISAFLVSLKWDKLRLLAPRGSMVGLLVLVLGVLGQVAFRATGTEHMCNLSILVVLIGGVLFVFGWEHLKLLWLPIGYLACAIPFPMPVYVALTTRLQEIAAQVGLAVLQLLGSDAELSGTIINVYRGGIAIPLNVELACSGMKMLVAFFAVAVALAYSTSRPVWQKIFLAACALPIAIFCNAMRVAFTALLVSKFGEQWAHGSAHSYFGLLMLIPAMGMQLGIAWILDRIFVEEPDSHGPAAGAGEGGS